jgi:hypothetical protein
MHFVSKLWRGRVALVKAFWLFGVMGTVLVTGACVLSLPASGVPSLPGLLLISLVAFGYQVLVSVGVWRSAGAYAGQPLYAVGARLAVAAYATLGIFTLGQMLMMWALLMGVLIHPPFIK